MSNETLIKAIKIILKTDNADFEGQKDIVVIKKAEEALGLKFPVSYKEFLLKLGCGDINGVEFYGIITENFYESGIPDGIWLTLDERKNFGLDKKFILISDSIEYYYALDTSQMNEGECPVVELLPGGKIVDIVAPTFGDFLYGRITGAISF